MSHDIDAIVSATGWPHPGFAWRLVLDGEVVQAGWSAEEEVARLEAQHACFGWADAYKEDST